MPKHREGGFIGKTLPNELVLIYWQIQLTSVRILGTGNPASQLRTP